MNSWHPFRPGKLTFPALSFFPQVRGVTSIILGSVKTLLILTSLTFSFASFGQFQPKCQAPGQGFLEGRVKEAFQTHLAEKELKDVVLDQRNYTLREDVKALNRRKMYADRIQLKELESETHSKFDQMIETTGRNEDITDWPHPRSFARLSGSGSAIAIELNNLTKEDLEVLPKPVLDKLSNKVKIEYRYPYDAYEYTLTYDGRELPMEKAMNKMQDDFEEACEQTLRDNQNGKDLQDLDRKSRGLDKLEKWDPNSGSSSAKGNRQ